MCSIFRFIQFAVFCQIRSFLLPDGKLLLLSPSLSVLLFRWALSENLAQISSPTIPLARMVVRSCISVSDISCIVAWSVGCEACDNPWLMKQWGQKGERNHWKKNWGRLCREGDTWAEVFRVIFPWQSEGMDGTLQGDVWRSDTVWCILGCSVLEQDEGAYFRWGFSTGIWTNNPRAGLSDWRVPRILPGWLGHVPM